MRHRQIPVIQRMSDITNRAARRSTSRMSMAGRNRERLRFVADAVTDHQRGNPGPAPERFQRQAAGAQDEADRAS
jgi:hypothetical protein